MKKLLLGLLLIPSLSWAGWTPSLDLGAAPQAGFAREIHDGNWLYTAAWAPFTLTHSNPWVPQFHAGIIQGWRADAGDPATGVLAGATVKPLAAIIQGANAALQLDSTWKPIAYLANAVYTDGFVGYRLQHGTDVHPLVYGVNFELKIQFGNAEIKQGL